MIKKYPKLHPINYFRLTDHYSLVCPPQVFKAAQPALLYLVPFTLLPLFAMAYLKGDLRTMWHEPFATPKTSKCQEI